MADVYTEIWTGEVERKFRAQATFMSPIPDRSEWVGNGVIHLSDLGVDPNVLVDNTIYPIPIVASDETDIPISMRKLETENTPVSDDELYAISYDKMAEKVDQHKNSIIEKSGALSAYALTPGADTEFTPIEQTTGGDNGSGFKRLTDADIAKMALRFNLANVPEQGRILVLDPQHVFDLTQTNQNFANQVYNQQTGKVLGLHGFQIHMYTKSVLFDSTMTKKAFGAAPAAGDLRSSFAFHAPSMVKAMGFDKSQQTFKMYWREAEKDPENRRNVIGFRTHYVCLPKANRYFGAIVTDTVV